MQLDTDTEEFCKKALAEPNAEQLYNNFIQKVKTQTFNVSADSDKRGSYGRKRHADSKTVEQSRECWKATNRYRI